MNRNCLLCFFVALLLGGCAVNSDELTYEVVGQLKLRDKVLTSDLLQDSPEVTVQFRSDKNVVVASKLASDGTYATKLPAGSYRVAVNVNYAAGNGGKGIEAFKAMTPRSPIPSNYQYFESSGLRIEVAAGEQNTHNIELKSARR